MPSKIKKVRFSQDTEFGDPDAKGGSSAYSSSVIILSDGKARRKEERWLSAIRALWSAECMAAETGHGIYWAFAITCKGPNMYWFDTLKPTGESEPKDEPWLKGLHPLGLLPNACKSQVDKHRGLCWISTHSLLVSKRGPGE